MRNVPLIIPFLLALFALLFSKVFFPTLNLLYFTPFFALLFMRSSFLTSLWISLLCGLLIDLFSSKFSFGFSALNCTLTTLLTYSQRRNFFEDRLFSLSCYTALISTFSSLIYLSFLLLFEKKFPFTFGLLFTDLLLMPAFDALYGFLWFTCPIKIYQNMKKRIIR